jgi:ABC-type glutathione transport system ATPase component
VRGLTIAQHTRGARHVFVNDVSFDVRAGEIRA